MIKSQISNKKQSGAILMIAMIMIAIMTSIGTSTLAKVMAETKSVRAGRKLLANDRPDNFNTLATIVSNKQRVFGTVENAPYLKPKVLDFVSIGNTRLTLNGLPVIYQMPNITTITCPSNQTTSVGITGSACPEYYESWLDNYQEIFSQMWETDTVTGDNQVGNDAQAAISGGDGEAEKIFTSDGSFNVSANERIIMVTILSFDPTTNSYLYTYNKDTIYVPANISLADYNNPAYVRLRDHLYVRDRGYKMVEVKIYSGNSYDSDNVFCADQDYNSGDRMGTACPSQCYEGVDEPICSSSYDVICLEAGNTYYTDNYGVPRTWNRLRSGTLTIGDFTFAHATKLDNACVRWDSAIIDCSVNNLNYNDPYVLPKADRYTFTNIEHANIFTVHNNTENMAIPIPAAQRDTCTSFPDHEDISVNLFMGAFYEPGASNSDKRALGAPNVTGIGMVENINPQDYWINFIESEHELLVNNPQVQALGNNDVLSFLVSTKDAPWMRLSAVFNKIRIGWASANSEQIVLTKFFNTNLELLAERKTSDPDCDDNSCIYEWNCGNAEIVSFDYWYTRIPYISLAGQASITTTDIGYYISGIGNVACSDGSTLPTIKPDPTGRNYLSEDKKATWTIDGGLALEDIGPRLRGIAGTRGCILDYAIFLPYDGTAVGNCVVNGGSKFNSVDLNYCVNTQGRKHGGYRINQHSSQNSHNDISGVICPNNAYVKEFKWYRKVSTWSSSSYSDMGLVKDIRCSDGTTLQEQSARGNLGNLKYCYGYPTECPTQGTSNSFRIWCDGEPLPPYDATASCLDRGFGAESAATIRGGATTPMKNSRGNTCN